MSDYEELLKDQRWLDRRRAILQRDKHICIHCKNDEIKKISRKGKFNRIIRTWDGNSEIIDDIIHIRTNILIEIEDADTQEIQNAWILPRHDIPRDFDSKISIYFSIEKSDELVNDSEQLEYTVINVVEDKSLLNEERYFYVRGLQVHHEYYQEDKLPWEYPDVALTTLCWICHKKLHSQNIVKRFNQNGDEIGCLTPCFRCGGTGYFPQYYYNKMVSVSGV